MPLPFSATVAESPEVTSGVSFWPVMSILTTLVAVAPRLSVAVTVNESTLVTQYPEPLNVSVDSFSISTELGT